MNARTVLAVVVLLAIGVLALPSTVSLFVGQHDWYAKQDVALMCDKCHADIAAELSQSAVHTNMKCIDCHQVNKVPQGAHAAATVACTDCHQSVVNEFQNDVHLPYYQAAMNDNLMTGPNEACIGCHTHAGVNITFVHKNTLEFTAEANGAGQWTISQMQAK